MTSNGHGLRVAWLGHRSQELAGGMATYSHEITSGLRRRGHKVTFLTLKAGVDGAPDHGMETVGLDAMPLLQARRRVVERFSLSSNLDALVGLYAEVAGR